MKSAIKVQSLRECLIFPKRKNSTTHLNNFHSFKTFLTGSNKTRKGIVIFSIDKGKDRSTEITPEKLTNNEQKETLTEDFQPVVQES